MSPVRCAAERSEAMNAREKQPRITRMITDKEGCRRKPSFLIRVSRGSLVFLFPGSVWDRELSETVEKREPSSVSFRATDVSKLCFLRRFPESFSRSAAIVDYRRDSSFPRRACPRGNDGKELPLVAARGRAGIPWSASVVSNRTRNVFLQAAVVSASMANRLRSGTFR